MLAPGEERAAANTAFGAVTQFFPEGAPGSHRFQASAENPQLASLAVLETVDRTDAEPATVCEVIGCGASLEGLKRYYIRMRVCERHLHAQAIVVNGVVSRFCQQCAKFQFVGEFSGSKKSCAATLERHNARHRAKVQARVQYLNDGDSDAAPTGGRAKGRPKATAGARRKTGQLPAAGRGAGGAASARTASERTNSDTSGAGTPEMFCWAAAPLPPQAAVAGQAVNGHQEFTMDFGGGGAYTAGQALAAAPGVPTHSSAAPVLSADATAPSKPASPHPSTNFWDGASSSLLQLRPWPLVTTGGNGVVSTGDRTHAPHAGGDGSGPVSATLQLPQQLLQAAGMQSSWPLQQQHALQQLPYDVRSGLAAVQGQLVPDAHGRMAQASAESMGLRGGGGHGFEYGTTHGAPSAWHAGGFPAGGPPPCGQAAASGGSTPEASSALAASGSDASAAKTSQATARQAMHAAAAATAGGLGSGGFYAHEGFHTGVTKSGGGHHSEAEPCGSSGRVAMNAASPAASLNDGVSATRVSASGAGMGDDGAAAATASAPPPPQLQAGDVAARINSIMQELCPLIAQFRQEVAHGSFGPHESTFPATSPERISSGSDTEGFNAGVAAAAGAGTAALPAVPEVGGGQVAGDRMGSSSLPSLLEMMHQASQLAASLHLPRGDASPNPPPLPLHVWTVTSGGPEPRLPTEGSLGPDSTPSVWSPELTHAYSHPLQLPLQQQQQQQRHAQPATGWRPLVSHPGIVINEAAAQHAATYAAATGPFTPAPVPAPAPAAPGVVLSSSSTSTTATAMAGTANQVAYGGGGGYSGHALPAGSAEASTAATEGGAVGLGYGAAQQLPPLYPAGPGPSSTVAKGEDSDDEMFQQLLTFLQDESAGDEHATAQQQQHHQQQQLFQGIASTAQHAVSIHQQVVHALPYGHVPTSPFYWPAAPAAPPSPAQPYPPPALPHHQYQQPYHFQQPLLPVQSPFGWPSQAMAAAAPAVADMHAQETDDVDPREFTRVSLKAMNVLPHELPTNLRSNLRRWLKEARAEALQATLRPGCLQLVVDVLRPPSAAAELSSVLLPANDADQAAADVFRVLGQRLRDTYVQVDRRVLQMRVGERPVVLSWEEAAEDGGLDGAEYPSLKGCSAAAVCAGSEAALQLSGGHLTQPSTKVYARLRGHDLRTVLLPTEARPADSSGSSAATATSDGGGGGGGSLRMTVAVPPGSVGLMAVEVGVGHLLGDWWPVLVLPQGCEGAADEVRRLQADSEAAVQAQPQARGREVAGRTFQRMLIDLSNVLEVSSAAAAAASSAAANAVAASAAARAQAQSSSGGAATDAAASPDTTGGAAAAPAGVRSPVEGRCPSPSGGTSSNMSQSDGGFTAVSGGGWSCAGRTDTLMSTNAGSTLGSFMTTSSARASSSMVMAAGQTHAQTLASQQVHHLAAGAAAAGGVPAAVVVGVAGAAAAAPVALLPPPPTATMRQALSRASRLLRFAVARGLPHLAALLLAAANCLVRAPDGNRQPQPPPASQPSTQAAAPGRAELLASSGVDLQALLPLAVLSGSDATVDRLTTFAARVLGSPLRLDLPQGPGGLSPLHLAALLPDGGALACHLLATQSWAAWEWLSLGWTPPAPLLAESLDGGRTQQQQQATGIAPAAANATAPAEGSAAPAADRKDEAGAEDEEDEESEDEEVLRQAPPRPLRLTPGLLSVLLGNNSTVRKAVAALVAQRGSGAGASLPAGYAAGSAAASAAASAALVTAVEAWGRTGVALLEALCSQLAQQSL